MSKVVGNTVDPLKVIGESGADILRLWAPRSTISRTSGSARRSSPAWPTRIASCATPSAICSARSTGSARRSGSTPAEMPELERYVLHLLAELDAELRAAVDDFDFNRYVARADRLLQRGSVAPSSSISARTASIATRRPTPKRRAYRTVLDTCSTRWCAGWRRCCASPPRRCGGRASRPRLGASARMAGDRRRRGATMRSARAGRWSARSREQVTGGDRAAAAREDDRLEPRGRRCSFPRWRCGPDRAGSRKSSTEIYIVSEVVPAETRYDRGRRAPIIAKCGRCWRHLPEVPEEGGLCDRCEEVVNG